MPAHHATPPPHSAIPRPTWRGPPSPRYSAMSPYDITRPGGIASATSRTLAAKSPSADWADSAGNGCPRACRLRSGVILRGPPRSFRPLSFAPRSLPPPCLLAGPPTPPNGPAARPAPGTQGAPRGGGGARGGGLPRAEAALLVGAGRGTVARGGRYRVPHQVRRKPRVGGPDQGGAARRQRARRAGAAHQPVLPVPALRRNLDARGGRLHGKVVAGEPRGRSALVDGRHAEHARVVGRERGRRVAPPAGAGRVAGVAGRGEDRDVVVQRVLERLPHRQARQVVTQRHAGCAAPVVYRVHDRLGQLALNAGLRLMLVTGKAGVRTVGDHPDREHVRLRRG